MLLPLPLRCRCAAAALPLHWGVHIQNSKKSKL
jgi:hypothetical protein